MRAGLSGAALYKKCWRGYQLTYSVGRELGERGAQRLPHLDASIGSQLGVLDYLLAAVPGQCPAQLGGHGGIHCTALTSNGRPCPVLSPAALCCSASWADGVTGPSSRTMFIAGDGLR